MKKMSLLMIAAMLVFTFSLTACGAPGNAADANGPGGRQFLDDGSIRGIVTAISDTQVEIAKMTGGGRQDNQNPPSDAQGNQGTGNNRPPAVSGDPQAQPSMDTSNMEKVQYAIDSNTKIVKRELQDPGQGQGSGPNATEAAAGISELKQGTMVSITPQSGNDKTAAKIVITEGFGGRGSRDGMNAPANTQNAK